VHSWMFAVAGAITFMTLGFWLTEKSFDDDSGEAGPAAVFAWIVTAIFFVAGIFIGGA